MKLIGVAVAASVLAVLAGCGGDSSFTAKGTLGLVAVDAATDDCSAGKDGYDDIHEGAEVVVTDADNKKLAVSSLKAGKAEGDDGLCVFDFKVPDIPSGKGPYGVEIAHRGQASFTEKQADSIVVSLG